jgi:hypothetical protein
MLGSVYHAVKGTCHVAAMTHEGGLRGMRQLTACCRLLFVARRAPGIAVAAAARAAMAAITAGGTSAGGDGISYKKGLHAWHKHGPAAVVIQERVLWCCARISSVSDGAGAEELRERGRV